MSQQAPPPGWWLPGEVRYILPVSVAGGVIASAVVNASLFIGYYWHPLPAAVGGAAAGLLAGVSTAKIGWKAPALGAMLGAASGLTVWLRGEFWLAAIVVFFALPGVLLAASRTGLRARTMAAASFLGVVLGLILGGFAAELAATLSYRAGALGRDIERNALTTAAAVIGFFAWYIALLQARATKA